MKILDIRYIIKRIMLSYPRLKKSIFKIIKIILVVFGLLAITCFIVMLIWFSPKFSTNVDLSKLTPKEKVDFYNETRKTNAQIIGGVVILIGVYLTFRRVFAIEKTVKVTEEGQITERFTRAIEQLGSDKIEIRLGGIYALERIAKDSEKDHWTIMEILTSYVRENSNVFTTTRQLKKTLKPVTSDVQAILTVLGRRNIKYDPEYPVLDLRYTNLKEANFSHAHLVLADFRGAHLEQSIFFDADLDSARLDDTYLMKANLAVARLRRADFINAHLEGANLTDAILRGTLSITAEQLCMAESLIDATMDSSLRKEIEQKCPKLLEPQKIKNKNEKTNPPFRPASFCLG